MRRTHVRGKQAVHNDIGIMLMSMNLTKLALEAKKRGWDKISQLTKKMNEFKKLNHLFVFVLKSRVILLTSLP